MIFLRSEKFPTHNYNYNYQFADHGGQGTSKGSQKGGDWGRDTKFLKALEISRLWEGGG